MSRRRAREYAFMFLYQLDIRNNEQEEQRQMFLDEYPLDKKDLEYFDHLYQCVFSERVELDTIYEPFLKGWTIQRLPRVDVILLRIAVFEITEAEDVPKSVVINEAVILAKKYSAEDSKAYINGVLGKIPEGQKSERKSAKDEK